MADEQLLLGRWTPAPSADDPRAGWLGARPRPVFLAAVCVVLALGAGAVAPSHLKYAVGVVGVTALVGAVLLWPRFGAYLLVGLVPVTSGLASGFPVSRVRLSEAIIGLVGVTLLVSVRRRDVVPWGTLDWALASYSTAWILFGILADLGLHQHLSLTQWGTVLGQLQFFLVYRAVRVAIRSARERRTALAVLVISTIPVSLLALLQKLNAPHVRLFIYKMVGATTTGTAAASVGHSLRVTGPFANWAALAGFLLPTLLVLVAMALGQVRVRRSRWFLAAGILGAVGLALTDEQSAIICCAVGAVVLAKRYGKGRAVLRWAPLLVLAAAVFAGPSIVHRIGEELAPSAGTGRVSWIPQTLSFRWSVWTQQYFPAIWQRPLSGFGVVLPPTIRWQYPESQYVSFLMEGGFPMLGLFGVLSWAMLRGARDAARSADPLDRALGNALGIAIVSMLVMNTMWPFLSNGGMPQVLWALLALAVPLGRSRIAGNPVATGYEEPLLAPVGGGQVV